MAGPAHAENGAGAETSSNQWCVTVRGWNEVHGVVLHDVVVVALVSGATKVVKRRYTDFEVLAKHLKRTFLSTPVRYGSNSVQLRCPRAVRYPFRSNSPRVRLARAECPNCFVLTCSARSSWTKRSSFSKGSASCKSTSVR